MATMFTKWLRKTLKRTESADEQGCRDPEKCMEVLHLLLDGEASEEESKYFRQHIQRCMPCYECYNLEMAIKEIIQTKIERKPVPQDLVNTIKLKIKETV